MRTVSRFLILLLVVSVLAVGCGGFGGQGSSGGNLRLGYLEWDENVAVSNLTKVVLEEELGYESVELKLLALPEAFQEVSSGEIDAFQDVWMPNHRKLLERAAPGVEKLDPWYEGRTSYGIAVPDYMTDIRSLGDLNAAGTNQILGIEPRAEFHPQISSVVIPEYDLDMVLVESSTPAMLSQLERSYEAREPVVFLRWEPHWMNARYDLRYLEDPKDAQAEFNDPATLSSIVNENLSEEDPVSYAFLDAVSLDTDQVNQLELEINNAGDPVEGAKTWLESNRDVAEPWIRSAKEAR